MNHHTQPWLGLVLMFMLGTVCAAQGQQVLGYYPYWMKTSYPASTVAYEHLTHISHAFIWPQNDGSLTQPVNIPDPDLTQTAHTNGVNVVIGVGGAGLSWAFPTIAADPNLRATFIANVVAFCQTHGYDGVDLDWEFPGWADTENVATLIRELRTALDAVNPDYTLSAAVPATNWNGQYYPADSLAKYLDWISTMTYDFHGGWTNHAGPNSPLYPHPTEVDGSVSQSAAYWIGRGIPTGQLNIGIPFYGRQFTAEALYASSTGGGTTPLYQEIAQMQAAGWTYHWDDDSQTPWLKSPAATSASKTLATQVITFDDPASAAAKATYARDQNLHGVVMWALGQDYNTGTGSEPILQAVGEVLNDVALPVEITTFEAAATGNAVTLSWITASESDNAGFFVLRNAEFGVRNGLFGHPSRTPHSEFRTRAWEEVAWIEGHGTTTEAHTYRYDVRDLAPGKHRLRLKQVDFDGTATLGPEVEVTVEMPEAFVLEPVYPNPFNPVATVSFAVREAATVRVELYNALGQRERVLYEGPAEGRTLHHVRLDGTGLPSGLYLVRLVGETFSSTQRVTLLK